MNYKNGTFMYLVMINKLIDNTHIDCQREQRERIKLIKLKTIYYVFIQMINRFNLNVLMEFLLDY